MTSLFPWRWSDSLDLGFRAWGLTLGLGFRVQGLALESASHEGIRVLHDMSLSSNHVAPL